MRLWSLFIFLLLQMSFCLKCLHTQTINCGYKTCCAIGLPRNHLQCWGGNQNYQVSGRPSYGVMAVSCSFWACCAVVKGTRGVKCWGGNAFAELNSPQEGVYTAVSCNRIFCCALRAVTGAAVCWGGQVFSAFFCLIRTFPSLLLTQLFR